MSMALRRDKGSGTIYFNNITQKWFASCPIGVYVNQKADTERYVLCVIQRIYRRYTCSEKKLIFG